MSEENLKPCPFCGGSAKIVEAGQSGQAQYRAYCTACQSRTDYYASREAAAAHWNTVESQMIPLFKVQLGKFSVELPPTDFSKIFLTAVLQGAGLVFGAAIALAIAQAVKSLLC